MVKFDDASWHYGGDFPSDLPKEAGGVHSAMFLCCALQAGLGGAIHIEEFAVEMNSLRQREITPGAYFRRCCDEKLTDEDFNPEGNEFAASYYDFQNGEFLKDYDETCGSGLPSLYHVPDTWETFDLLKPVFDRRLHEWRQRKDKSR